MVCKVYQDVNYLENVNDIPDNFIIVFNKYGNGDTYE